MPLMPKNKKRFIAGCVAQRMRKELDGPITEPSAWVQVGERLGCSLFFACDIGRLGLYWSEITSECGVIVIREGLPPSTACRVLVHEIAHHLCRVWVPLFFADDLVLIEGWDDDPAFLCHEVCRLVEVLCLEENFNAGN